MILSDTAIKQPVFTTMVISAIVIFGIISFRALGIDLFPRVEFPIITVVSVLPGADPETVETTVSDPIEEAVSTISGIKALRSVSADSVSQVIVEFELHKDIDVAFQEVQAKLGTVRSELPPDVEDPIVEKFDIDSAPIMAVVLSGPLPLRDLTQLADKVVKERLQRVRNVGQVKLIGGRDRKIWVWIDRDKLEGHGLSSQDVERALRVEHVEAPGGRIETGPREYLVKTKAEFRSAEELASLVIAYRGGTPVRVNDIGWVEDGLVEERSRASLNGEAAISLLVRRQSGTNTVQVATGVKQEVDILRRELAAQKVQMEIAQDQSIFIEHSVAEVQFHLVFGGGLAILIVLFFLRNLRSTFISSLVLPTSVIGTFIMMNSLGFTQNMMTLLALSLAIGLLIDDSIVVQENIMRHVEEGMPAREAAQFATSEIALAVFATTMSVVAVFVPVATMEGLIGRFFYQFGMTVAFAVLISMFVAFTLDPMISSRILRKPKQGRLYRVSEAFFSAIDRAYGRTLEFALRHRWLVVLLALGAFVASGQVAKYLRFEFIPDEDQSEFNIKLKAPQGSSLAATDALLGEVRQRIQEQSWLDYTFATIGADELQRVNEGALYVKMTDLHERDLRQNEAMEWVRKAIADIAGAKISVEPVPRVSGGGRGSALVQLDIRGSDLDVLEELAADVMDTMRQSPGYVDIDTNYEKGRPEINVFVQRDRAADLGVSPATIASTIYALVGGTDVSKFKAEGDRYDIGIRLQERFRSRIDDIEKLSIRNTRGELVPLRNVTWQQRDAGPVQINRFSRSRLITITANLEREKKVLGEATAELTEFLESKNLPAGYSFGFIGMADVMQEAFANLMFALFLAVVIVYMVLASQFESFLHPLTIMMSLPLSIVGALGALVALGHTMSIFTMIGIIMLMGLVTKNAILLVDFTNLLRTRDGMGVNAALLKAGPIRLRPILMTTLAMIFGMLPIALGTGAGSESRSPMAVAVIGGLTTSTLLTLVVVPVVYTFMDELRHPAQWRIVVWLRDLWQNWASSSDENAEQISE